MAHPKVVAARRQIVGIKLGKLLVRAAAEHGVTYPKATAHPRRDPQLAELEVLEAWAAVIPQLLDKLNRPAAPSRPASPQPQRRTA